MTAKTVEDLLVRHASGIATLEEGQENLEKNLTEVRFSSSKLFDELRRLIDDQNKESADHNLRLSLAEKEIADLRVVLERSRSFRWALVATLISVSLSSIASAAIAFYVKPK